MQLMQRGGCSRVRDGELVWKMIWNLKVPNAVKMFMWRACNNLLPTKMNLMRRGVVQEAKCPICGREDETAKHILWSCPSAQDVWSCGPTKLQKGIGEGITFVHVVEEMIGRCDLAELEILAVVARKIWFRRNSVVHGGDFIHPTHVFRDAINSLEDFQKANTQDIVLRSPLQDDIPTLWRKPPPGIYKINWDAAVDKDHGRIGFGIIVRDHEGLVLAARSFTRALMVEPVVAEALAGFYAVEFSRDMSFFDIFLEGDALQIVSAVKTNNQRWSKFGHIIDGIRSGLHHLRSWQIHHVKRDANSAAHTLAREAIKSVIDRVWIEEVPPCIYGIVIREQIASV
jgi:hypothetical protein